MMKRMLMVLILLIAAEVLASAALWHGTPTDWPGERLHFWAFESSRLGYWGMFLLVFAVLWIGLRRLFSHRPVRNLLAGICSVGIELFTSLSFWKRLQPSQVAYLGWWNLAAYSFEHMFAWAIVVAVGLGIWFLLSRSGVKNRGTTEQYS